MARKKEIASTSGRGARGRGRFTPTVEETTPLLLRARQAAALCNTSLRTWRTWDAAGRIPRAIRIGRSTYWREEEIRAWIHAGCPDRRTWKTLRE